MGSINHDISIAVSLTTSSELRSQDDIESLAYTLFYLALGNLPWRDVDITESTKSAMERVHDAKQKFVAALPITGVPSVFSTMFQVVETLSHELLNSMIAQQQSLRLLFVNSGAKDNDALDLTRVPAPTSLIDIAFIPTQANPNYEHTEEEIQCNDDQEEFTDSYDEYSFAEWDIQSGRDQTLTFPSDDVKLLDGQIPDLAYILEE